MCKSSHGLKELTQLDLHASVKLHSCVSRECVDGGKVCADVESKGEKQNVRDQTENQTCG